MQIIATEVTEGLGPNEGFLVEFRGDGGEKVSVHLAQTENGNLTSHNALQKAQVLLLQASRFGMTDAEDEDLGGEPSEAVESLRQEQEEKADAQHGGSELQEGLEDTFPASDPVSASHTSTVAGDSKH
jgi:hypothetical protein